jgi:hypothetical protein
MGTESRERLTDDPDIRWAAVQRITLGEFSYWSVAVAVAEFLRTDPLESELRQQTAAALRGVDGVETVWEDDREVWGVTGAASGETLVRAAAGVVDHLATRHAPHTDSFG